MRFRSGVLFLFVLIVLGPSVEAFAQSAALSEREVGVGAGLAFGVVMVGERAEAQSGPAGLFRVGLGQKNRWSVDVDVQPFQATDPLRPQALRSLHVVPSYRVSLGRAPYLRIGAGAAFNFWSDSSHSNENEIAVLPDARHPSVQVRPVLGVALGYQFRTPGAGFAIAPETFLHISGGNALVSAVSFGGVRVVASWFRGPH